MISNQENFVTVIDFTRVPKETQINQWPSTGML